MSAEAYREEEMYREAEPDLINIKRNPYLVDYEQQRRLREHREQRISPEQEKQRLYQRTQRISQRAQEQELQRVSRRASEDGQELQRVSRRASQGGQELQRVPRRVSQGGQRSQREQELKRVPRRASQSEERFQREQEDRRVPRRALQREERVQQEERRVPRRAPQNEGEIQWDQEGQSSQRLSRRGQEAQTISQRAQLTPGRAPQRERVRQEDMELYLGNNVQARKKRAAMEKKRAVARRKRIVRMQRMVLFVGVFCITLLCGILYMKRIDAKTPRTDTGNADTGQKVTGDIMPVDSSSSLVQGLPATEFAKHPEWEENFLTPNEYSRPGDALEEVNNIFVHYTANPKTSAAQNRSYFEQLKDTHITSASAHFIIGYNGEIIQCIPLDEIAYAVQTRNFDSVSIECCYKSADGSFTQETYDSLIELLAWLTDVYDLTTDDILRHYDCGGKKCPIYYTEHEDAWERLKKDVGEKL